VSGRTLASFFHVGARGDEEVRGQVSRRKCCCCQAPDRLTFICVTLGFCLSVASTLARHPRLLRSWLDFRTCLLGSLHAHATSVHRSNVDRDRTWDALTSIIGGGLCAPLLPKHKTIPFLDSVLQQPVAVGDDQ